MYPNNYLAVYKLQAMKLFTIALFTFYYYSLLKLKVKVLLKKFVKNIAIFSTPINLTNSPETGGNYKGNDTICSYTSQTYV